MSRPLLGSDAASHVSHNVASGPSVSSGANSLADGYRVQASSSKSGTISGRTPAGGRHTQVSHQADDNYNAQPMSPITTANICIHALHADDVEKQRGILHNYANRHNECGGRSY